MLSGSERPDGDVHSPADWGKLLAGFVAVFALFQAAAQGLGSDRGQSGFAIAGLVIAALVVVECLLFRQSPRGALRVLGLGLPAKQGVETALLQSSVLLLVIPVYVTLQESSLTVDFSSDWTLAGLFAQAGIAEETLFRGYLFQHLRRGRTFWRAAALSAVPFTLVHLYLFATMPWTVALAAVLLATIISFPLAYLFELGGNTIWAPALLHFTAQGAIKVLNVPGDPVLPLVWMAAVGAISYLAFLDRRVSRSL